MGVRGRQPEILVRRAAHSPRSCRLSPCGAKLLQHQPLAQKHEARRFDSPGFAWEFSAMKSALFRGSPGEGAIHGVQALGLRMAGPGRPARLGRSLNERSLHVSRKNPGDA